MRTPPGHSSGWRRTSAGTVRWVTNWPFASITIHRRSPTTPFASSCSEEVATARIDFTG